MTINGGQPHKVGYAGQSHVVAVMSREKGALIRIGWMNPKHDDAVAELLRGLNLNPDWTEAQIMPVIDQWGNGWCDGCGSRKTMDELRAEGFKYGCCPDRTGAPSHIDIGDGT